VTEIVHIGQGAQRNLKRAQASVTLIASAADDAAIGNLISAARVVYVRPPGGESRTRRSVIWMARRIRATSRLTAPGDRHLCSL
jgi:hypothetical protein